MSLTEGSVFIRFCVYVYARLIAFYPHSFVGRMWSGVIRAFTVVWRGSGLYRLLFEPTGLGLVMDNDAAEKIRGFNGLLSRVRPHVREWARSSLIVRLFAVETLLFMPLRVYGVFLMGLGISGAILRVVNGQTQVVLFACMAVVGVVLLIIGQSPAALYNGSWLCKTIGRFFGPLGVVLPEREVKSPFVLFGLIGIAAGVACSFVSPIWVGAALVGAVGCAVVIRHTEAGLCALALLTPLLPTMLVLGICAVTIFSFFIRVLYDDEMKIVFKPIDLFVLIFLGVVLWSVPFSFLPSASLYPAALYVMFILIYFVVRNTVRTREFLIALVAILAVSAFLVAAYGFYQKLTGAFVMTESWIDTDMFENQIRVYSTLDNPNVLGEYLVLTMPVVFAMIFYYREWLNKLAATVVFGVLGGCLLLTMSRGAWLGLILGLGVFVCLKYKKLLYLLIPCLLVAPFVIPDAIIERFMSIGNLGDTSTAYRLNIWLSSLDMLKVYWPSGIGISTGTFTYVYQRFSYNALYAQHAHNLFLQLFIELGIGGMLAFLGYLLTGIKGLFVTVAKKTDAAVTGLSAAICGGLAGYLLQGMTDNVWYNYRVMLLFWLFIGLAAAIPTLTEGKHEITG